MADQENYQGDWDDLERAVSAPNCVLTYGTALGVIAVFKVHGKEGFRTYFYPAPEAEALEDAIKVLGIATGEAAGFLASGAGVTSGSPSSSVGSSQNGSNPRAMNSGAFE